jgi:hypothetical protein
MNLRNRLSHAHWCDCFSCSDRELIEAVRATSSNEVGVVGLYLATRPEKCPLPLTIALASAKFCYNLLQKSVSPHCWVNRSAV